MYSYTQYWAQQEVLWGGMSGKYSLASQKSLAPQVRTDLGQVLRMTGPGAMAVQPLLLANLGEWPS